MMHRCLTIPEMVQMVCSHLEPDEGDSPSLATLARTSSVFHGPALDRLWSYQNTIGNLLRCMPPDLFAFDSVVTGWNRRATPVYRILLAPIDSHRFVRAASAPAYCCVRLGKESNLCSSIPEIILRSSWTVVIPDPSRTEHVFTRGLPLSQCLRPLLVQSSRRRLPLHRYISDSGNHTHFLLALLGFPFFHPLNAPA